MIDCWNRIGVRGDRSCDKLPARTHCRNCEVHAESAHAVMQRPLPHGYREEWAGYFAKEETGAKELDRSALIFRIGAEWLALPAKQAVMVAQYAKPHRLPHRGGGALSGIVNVKGRLYPCMSIAELLSITAEEPTRVDGRRAAPRLVVMDLAQQRFALPVDDLHGIHRYAEADVEPVPTNANKSMYRYFTGILVIGSMRVGRLDAELVGHKLAGALK